MMVARRVWVPVLLITLLALAVRLPGAGQTMTADEARWMERSSHFMRAITHGDIKGTFSTTHPGVVPMWLIGSGMLIKEASSGVVFDEPTLAQFREAATVPVILVTSVLVGLATYLMLSLLGPWTAIMAGILLAIDPYIAGLSRISHLDALLALFMLTAFLAWLQYLRVPTGRRLLLAGILAGLAAATKLLPALWLAVAIGLLELLHLWQKVPLWTVCKRYISWVLLAAATVVVIWPALWQPQDFGNVYYTSGLYDAYRGDIKRLALEDQVPTEDTTETIQPASFYLRTVVSRSTPLNLLITLGVIIVLIRVWLAAWRQQQTVSMTFRSMTWLTIYAVGFLILITAVGKKSDRYALPALVMLPILTGWILATLWPLAWQWLGKKWGGGAALAGSALVALALLLQTALWYPYYSTYASPLGERLIPSAQRGWGEGLDAAARWLNEQPGSETMMVASWYPTVFGTYFHGQTTSLSARDDARVAYVVLYKNMFGRSNEDDATGILEEFKNKTPLHVISIQGEPYVWIYDRLGVPYFPEHTGELIGDMEVGQLIPIHQNNWGVIEIGMSNFSGRHNTHDVILHVKESPDAPADLRTVTINASQVIDSDWNRFTFDPIPDSQEKKYYVSLTSPDSVPGNAITIRYSKTDLRPGQMFWRRRALKAGESMAAFEQKGDIAYKLDQ